MLLKIYELITKIQEEIGNNAEVRFTATEQILVVRVDWWKEDLHALREFNLINLENPDVAERILEKFIFECKHGYESRIKSAMPPPRKIKYEDGQPCEHKGCMRHVSHPCEGCGRVSARGVIYEDENPMILILPPFPF